MKPSAIIKLILSFNALILIGVVLIIIFSKDKQSPLSTDTVPSTDDKIPERIQAEIIESAFSEPDEVTEEYHLELKVSIRAKDNEKITNPTGDLVIETFAPADESMEKLDEDLIMKHMGTKRINLVETEMTDGEIQIHLKSGFKVATESRPSTGSRQRYEGKVTDTNHYLSLCIIYEDINPATQQLIRLRHDIPIYKY